MTQMELSQELGYKYNVVATMENGTKRINELELARLQQVLRLDESELEQIVSALEKPLLAKPAPNKGSRKDVLVNRRVAALRKEHRMSMREFGDLLGIMPSHYSKIESEEASFTVQQLQRIHKELHVSYDFLFDGKPDASPTYQQLLEENQHLKNSNQLLYGYVAMLRSWAKHTGVELPETGPVGSVMVK